ncbi:MAG: hypothetical protein DHS20C14_09310 [Phycisphaeraceae bacterium]|nr:MAG: hypothetical protein DHS20C14_09310 [Phycisphaeraceae bacterium]
MRRRIQRLIADALDVIGYRRTVVVDGVRYRERTRDPLRRALSRVGSGVKEYDVRFPATARRKRTTMRIRCTNERRYADVGPTRRPTLYDALEGRIRPGMRVFELGCSTGAGSTRLSTMVGPSGGVVSVDTDRESVRFARLRYLEPQLAFEIGGVETLTGELDGAFDAAIAMDALGGDEDTTKATLAELWRVVGPSGWLFVLERVRPDEVDRLGGQLRELCGPRAEVHASPPLADATVLLAAQRPTADEPGAQAWEDDSDDDTDSGPEFGPERGPRPGSGPGSP